MVDQGAAGRHLWRHDHSKAQARHNTGPLCPVVIHTALFAPLPKCHAMHAAWWSADTPFDVH